MTETKHTPGPWRVSHDGIWARSPWNADVRIATVMRHSPLNGIDSDANGCVMAAGPEMLTVLRTVRPFVCNELRGYLECSCVLDKETGEPRRETLDARDRPFIETLEAMLASIDIAIAKAEGRTNA